MGSPSAGGRLSVPDERRPRRPGKVGRVNMVRGSPVSGTIWLDLRRRRRATARRETIVCTIGYWYVEHVRSSDASLSLDIRPHSNSRGAVVRLLPLALSCARRRALG